DLRVVPDADDDRVGGETRLVTQVGRHEHPPLAVQLRFDRAGEDLALEQPGCVIGEGQGGGAVREAFPTTPAMDRQATVDPARYDRPTLELDTESSGDGDSPL